MCGIMPNNYYQERNVKIIHPPNKFRVNEIFMNSEKMADVWKCPEKSPMNPKEKCYIW